MLKFRHTKYTSPRKFTMSALSIRLTPEIEKRLEMEVSRLKVTKSRFVQDLLESALAPKDAVALLMSARERYGLDELAKTAEPTHKAANVKALVREAVQKKHAAEKVDTVEIDIAKGLIAAEPRAKYGA
jgi:predicted DNA-binding protein